jgi:hypothetical protein
MEHGIAVQGALAIVNGALTIALRPTGLTEPLVGYPRYCAPRLGHGATHRNVGYTNTMPWGGGGIVEPPPISKPAEQPGRDTP